MPSRMVRSALALTIAVGVMAAAPAAHAATGTAAQVRPHAFALDLTVTRFAHRGDRTIARAAARTSVVGREGRLRVKRRHVTLAVKGIASCRILSLKLDTLQLALLGLNLQTSAVNLNITGNRKQTLGKLFCRLSKGIKLSKRVRAARAARSLNRRLRGHPLRVLALRGSIAPKQASAAQAGSCQVLKVVLGPLHLDLLGLLVDLYGPNQKSPVTVDLTADPNGGALGSLFCQLADTNVTLAT